MSQLDHLGPFDPLPRVLPVGQSSPMIRKLGSKLDIRDPDLSKVFKNYRSATPSLQKWAAKELAKNPDFAQAVAAKIGDAPEPVRALHSLVQQVEGVVNPALPGKEIAVGGKTYLELAHEFVGVKGEAAKNAKAFLEARGLQQSVGPAVEQMEEARRSMHGAVLQSHAKAPSTTPTTSGGVDPFPGEQALSFRGPPEFDPLGNLAAPGTVKGKIINISDNLRASTAAETLDMEASRINALRKGVQVPLTRNASLGRAVTPVTEDVRKLLNSGLGRAEIEERLINAIEVAGQKESASTVFHLQDVLKEFKSRIGERAGVGEQIAGNAAAAGAESEATAGLRGLAAQEAGVAGIAGEAAGGVAKAGGMGLKGLVGGAVGVAALTAADMLLAKEQGEYHSESFLSRAFGQGTDNEAVRGGFAQRDMEHEARMRIERLQSDMASNTVRLATMRPELYNQLLYNRLLPRGVTPIGGNPDDGFLNQVTLAMSMGKFNPPMSAEQDYASSMR